MPAIVEISGLSKSFGRTIGVKELNFSVEEGEIFGFLGPNGAGKTTTIRLMMNFIRPDSGQIYIFGKAVKWGDYKYKREIGYLPGELRLPPGVKGGALLDYWNEMSKGGKSERDRWLKALDFKPDDLHRYTREYSRGMRQKLGVIGALQNHPRLAVLDEPSEGLDPLVKHSFLEELKKLGDEGCTIFFSSHVLSEVEHLADTAGIIRKGTLVSKEGIEDLKSRQLRKKVNLHFIHEADLMEFLRRYPCQAERNHLHLSYISDKTPNDLINALHGLDIADFTISQPDLEEIFLEYYQDVD